MDFLQNFRQFQLHTLFIEQGGQEMGSIPENGGGGSPLVPKNRSRRSSDIGDLLRHGIVHFVRFVPYTHHKADKNVFYKVHTSLHPIW